jgi:hypothetical protein
VSGFSQTLFFLFTSVFQGRRRRRKGQARSTYLGTCGIVLYEQTTVQRTTAGMDESWDVKFWPLITREGRDTGLAQSSARQASRSPLS